VPKKALVRAGRIYRLVREAEGFGIRAPGASLDWARLVERQRAIVRRLQPEPESLERAGVRVVLGEARFADPHTLRVEGAAGMTEVAGERIVIGAGSAPVVPPVAGRELGITSNELLFLADRPRRLVLVGAGVIGLEMAGAFNDLGVEVTVVGRDPEILPGLDADVAAYIRGMLEARGVVFHLDARVTRLGGTPGAAVVTLEAGGAVRETPPATVCWATGRRWVPATLGAEGLGLETGRLGLATTPDLRTSLPHVWAAGDAAGNVQLTPTAALEGKVAARNALRGERAVPDLAVVPQTIFTTPEVARVGLTHREALERGVRCHVSTHDMRGASNGVATGEDGGFLKLVFEGGTERVLGVQMVSWAAAELIQLAALAIRAGATADLLSTQLSVHPSHAERFIKIAAHEYHEVCEV
jgi:pyruvate/2-oxoglutarate dehydrogenase complex dihydrolipoamide dehydrogenase (E3) component